MGLRNWAGVRELARAMDTLKFKNRRGKIARLPSRIREELNLRLDNGDPGPELLAWLNGLPEVQAILARQFGGRPIRQQNLSEWRLGGWQDWMQEQAALEAAGRIPEETRETMVPDGSGKPSLVETLTHWLSLRYVMVTRRINEAEGERHWRLLREFAHDVIRLQRAQTATKRQARLRDYDQFCQSTYANPAPKPEPPHPSKRVHASATGNSNPANPSPASRRQVERHRVPHPSNPANRPATSFTKSQTSPTQSPPPNPVNPPPLNLSIRRPHPSRAATPKPLESQISPAKLQTSSLPNAKSFTLGHLPKPTKTGLKIEGVVTT